jgi:hypothetical protein
MVRSFPCLVAVVSSTSALAFACGGGPPPQTAPTAGSEEPRVVIEDSTETWYEEESGKPGEKGTGVREYLLDVTKRVEWKSGGTLVGDAGPPPADKIYRIAVRFPVPKVEPNGARDVHTINRLLWEVRKEIAKCYYKGPGREPGVETSMIAWLKLSKGGEINGSGVEKSDDVLAKSGGFQECVMENVKGLAFGPAGDDTKVRFKLKLQTIEATGAVDAKTAPKGE